MANHLNPYLNFDGNAREAMEFYREVLGGELNIHTFGETGAPFTPDGVMHAQLHTDLGFVLMASDLPPGMELKAGGGQMTISISGEDEEALTRYWQALAAEGTVNMPFEKQMWGDIFGQVDDKFGIPWMVNVVVTQA